MSRRCLALAIALGLLGCEDDKPAAAPAPEPVAEAPQPEVASITGVVERRAGEDEWVPVSQGERLAPDSAIRTGENASADLKLGEKSVVTLEAESQVGVVEVTQAVQQLRIKRGRLKVSHEAERGRVLRIEGENGEVVETTAADFAVSLQGGSFAVATTRGSVQFESGGSEVAVAAGEQSFARAGLTPSAAARIPTELLLKVARARGGGSDVCAVVQGTAAPGSTVSVAGTVVSLDDKGGFRTSVPAKPDQTDVEVVTTDAIGRSKTESIACRSPRKPKPPKKEEDSTIDDLSIQWGSPKD